MVWPTIQLHGRQVQDYVIGITLVTSVTGVVMYLNKLSKKVSIDVIIRFYIMFVHFSNELVNSDKCPTTHIWWNVILPQYISHVLALSSTSVHTSMIR